VSARSQLSCRRKPWISLGITSSSNGTPRLVSRAARSTVWLKRTLRSSSPCINSTGERQVFTAYDANGKRIWSTVDCFPGTGTDVRLMQPGESLQYNIKWSGTTSQPGCAGDRLLVPAGNYTIVASIGGLKGSPVKLTLT